MPDVRQGRAWTAICARVYERDGRQCAECGTSGTKDNPLQIDHILPYSEYPELGMDLDNLQVLCRKHNLAKSNKTVTKRPRGNWYDPMWLSSIN